MFEDGSSVGDFAELQAELLELDDAVKDVRQVAGNLMHEVTNAAFQDGATASQHKQWARWKQSRL